MTNRQPTYSQQLKIIECAEIYGSYRASIQYNVTEKLINKWINKKLYILEKTKELSEWQKNYKKKWKIENIEKSKISNKTNKNKEYYNRHTFEKLRRSILKSIKDKELKDNPPSKLDLWKLALRQKLICPLSGIKLTRENISPDHIIPLHHGGTSDISNIQLVDKRVNIMKHLMTDEELIFLCNQIVNHNK